MPNTLGTEGIRYANVERDPRRTGKPPERRGGPVTWYTISQHKRSAPADPLLELYGSGKKIWADEPPDEYIKRIRRDWA